MSHLSNDEGRAYEFICLNTLCNEISKYRPCDIIENSSYLAASRSYNIIDEGLRNTMNTSAMAAVSTLFDMEPLILENDNDILQLYIQPDEKGKEGDVRDIIILRDDIRWEIGLSIKHNHFAVKHSRLSKNLDFGQKWYGIPCSQNYWDDVRNIFDFLTDKKNEGDKWSDLEDKENDVYVPLLNAFIDEIKRSEQIDSQLPFKMVEYLLGEFDFYKVISIDNQNVTQIQTYNIRGTLNKPGRTNLPNITVPIVSLPTRIVSLDFKPNSNNTVELYMDGGWQFSFRIHNASTYVESSLKFDIQIVGMPVSIMSINCSWNINN